MQRLYKLICVDSKYPMFIGTDKDLSEPGVFLLTEKETGLIEELKFLQIQYDKLCDDLGIGPNEETLVLNPEELFKLTNQINDVWEQVEKFTKEYVEIAKGLY